MPLNTLEHLDNLVRHIELVQKAGLLLGRRLILIGRENFGLILIAKTFAHDNSKFFGIEWDYLHAGKDIPKTQIALAIKQHVLTNSHHPEYWGNISNMPEIAVAEMLCDWYARSNEFGTGLRDWIEKEAVIKFEIDRESQQYKWIISFLNILLEDTFVNE